MVGQGVLRECLLDPEVQLVETVGRSATGNEHQQQRELQLHGHESGQHLRLPARRECLRSLHEPAEL